MNAEKILCALVESHKNSTLAIAHSVASKQYHRHQVDRWDCHGVFTMSTVQTKTASRA